MSRPKALKPCAAPGCPTLTKYTWCSHHRPARDDPSSRYRSSGQWKRTRATVLDDWRTRHGDWCPGDDDHPAHHCLDLTVDHLDPLATTGGIDTGRYAVRCRSSNSRRGAR